MSSKILVANWKMKTSLSGCLRYFDALSSALEVKKHSFSDEQTIIYCPSFPYLFPVQSRLIDHDFALGAQDCSSFEEGAYTGDVAATMLKDAGCSYVLVGHSERRQYHEESNSICKLKIERAHSAGLKVIYCIGERKEEREEGRLEDILSAQLANGLSDSATSNNTLIAYEPVWAIGTGLTPSLEDIQKTHDLIDSLLSKRTSFQDVKILYGGSVKPDNAKDILALPQVNGALIGGASLNPNDMAEIMAAATCVSQKAA